MLRAVVAIEGGRGFRSLLRPQTPPGFIASARSMPPPSSGRCESRGSARISSCSSMNLGISRRLLSITDPVHASPIRAERPAILGHAGAVKAGIADLDQRAELDGFGGIGCRHRGPRLHASPRRGAEDAEKFIMHSIVQCGRNSIAGGTPGLNIGQRQRGRYTGRWRSRILMSHGVSPVVQVAEVREPGRMAGGGPGVRRGPPDPAGRLTGGLPDGGWPERYTLGWRRVRADPVWRSAGPGGALRRADEAAHPEPKAPNSGQSALRRCRRCPPSGVSIFEVEQASSSGSGQYCNEIGRRRSVGPAGASGPVRRPPCHREPL